jgi:hypothetical protein
MGLYYLEGDSRRLMLKMALLWIVITLAIASVLFFSLNIPLDTDEYETLAASSFIAHGQIPYRDFWQVHTPFSYYFFAPLVLIFKTLKIFYPARVIIYLLLLLNGYFLFILAKRLFSKEAACFALLAYLSALPVLIAMIQIKPDVFVVLFSNLSLVLLVSKKIPPVSSFFLAGIFSALAVLSKQSGIIFFFCVNAFFIIRVLTDRWEFWKEGVFTKEFFNGKTYISFLSGFLLLLAIFILYLAKHSAFNSFMQYAIQNDWLRSALFLKTESLHFSPYFFGRDMLIINSILFVSALCFLLYLCLKKGAFKKSAYSSVFAIFMFLLVSFLSVFFIVHPWLQEFLLFSQYLVLLAALGLSLFYSYVFTRYGNHGKRFLGFVLSFFLFAVICLPPFIYVYQNRVAGRQLLPGFGPEPIPFDKIMLLGIFNDFNEVLLITNPEDRCLSVAYPIPFRPSVYFYRLTGPEFESSTALKHAEKSLLHELIDNRVVVVAPLATWGFDVAMPDLDRKIKDNYIQERNLFIPGKVLKSSNKSDVVFNVIVPGYYEFRGDRKDIQIDSHPFQKEVVYLTQGIHIFSLPDVDKEYTIMYDLKSNKNDSD